MITVNQIIEQGKKKDKINAERLKIHLLFKWMIFSYNLDLRDYIDWDNYLKLRV